MLMPNWLESRKRESLESDVPGFLAFHFMEVRKGGSFA